MLTKKALFLHAVVAVLVILILSAVKSAWNRFSLPVFAQYPTATPTRTPTRTTTPTRTPTATPTPTGWIVFAVPDDAHVYEGHKTNNYGNAVSLRARLDPPASYNIYLKFIVTGIVRSVQSAFVRLYVNDYSPDAGTIYSVSNNYNGTTTAWTEGGITWNNAPVITGTPLSSGGLASADTWIDFDVTEAITENGTYSFGIKSNSTNSVFYNSSEAVINHPELVIIEVPAPTSTPTRTPTATNTPTPSLSPTPGGPPVDSGTVGCSSGTTNVTTFSCGPIIGGNNLYVVTVIERGTMRVKTDGTGITGLGLTWTKRKEQCANNGSQAIELWTGYGNATDGSITVNYTASNYTVIFVTKYGNVDPTVQVENATSSNASGQESAVCSGGNPMDPTNLDVLTTANNSLIHVGAGTRNRIIETTSPAGYTQIDSNTAGPAGDEIKSFIHNKSNATPFSETVSHDLNGTAYYVMAALAIRPLAPPTPTFTPTPTFFQTYGYLYTETDNDASDRSSAVSEGLLGGYQVNLSGDANNTTTSQSTTVTPYPANYQFSPLYNGIYNVYMPVVPTRSVLFNPQNYTNPQVAIIAGGPVTVDFPFITITPTYAAGVPTPTVPGGGFPTATPSPTPLSATPTYLPTPTSRIDRKSVVWG